jgi:hypothetical protein
LNYPILQLLNPKLMLCNNKVPLFLALRNLPEEYPSSWERSLS